MRPQGKRHQTVPVQFGGQFSAGDPTTIPDGTVRTLRNYVIRANRFDCRAPFVYDSLDGVNGFAVWEDLVNEVTKTVAAKSSDQKLYAKNSSGTGYAAGISGLPTGNMRSATNFLGKLYMMFSTAGVPSAAAVYDGTNMSTTPFDTTIFSRIVTQFNDRLFFIYPRVTVTNQLYGNFSTTTPYEWNNAGGWLGVVSCTGATITVGSAKTFRITPTATTGAYMDAGAGVNKSVVSVVSQGTAVWRQDLANTSQSYQMPFTMELRISSPVWSLGMANAIGTMIVDSNLNLQRVIVNGNVGVSEPVWATTVGATTIDNTVTWICDGTNVVGSLEGVIPKTNAGQFATFFCTATLPLTSTSWGISPRFTFGNTATPTIQLASIDVSYRDGLTDGDARKANYGSQITTGDFYFPFFNAQSSASGTVNIDAIVWSEIGNAKQILAKNTFPMSNIAGLGTAGTVCNGRLVAFKRKGMYVFKGVADINEPILPETPAIRVGCNGPMALDVSHDDELFWIGEHHVYRMRVGAENTPHEIDTPGMFEEMFSRGSNWVESQSTYNATILAIDHANKDVWVYTQKGKIYIYSIQANAWSYIDTNPTGTAAEVAAMVFDPVSSRMLVSFGGQAATRFDETSDAADTIVAGGGTTWNIQSDIVPRPFELFAPRYEASLLEVGLFHNATVQNGTLTLSYSLDRGTNYTTPTGYPVSTFTGNPRIRMPLAATGESVTVKISRTGSGGARNWSISKADALIRVHRGELPKVNAT